MWGGDRGEGDRGEGDRGNKGERGDKGGIRGFRVGLERDLRDSIAWSGRRVE